MTRLSNGTVQLTWQLPPEINGTDLLTVEINLGDGWVPITASHLQVHVESKEGYTAKLRFHHAEWTGYLDVDIPPAPDADTGTSPFEIALVHSVIFVGVALGCAILLVIMLALKYVQLSRRKNDKGEEAIPSPTSSFPLLIYLFISH